ncbi:hypothetical protein HYFRA_00004413 [Hymenoscyphus fraxineus]|uniref:DUF6594 domain-containing protein n=1 Tax=Hymenoscyphus fraxineus TaxID=746836 RepID=A0A9N9PST8_9HELO|nr:hypothetical protein HYFRA_00004413 [Hymenoscyphus fraxineus]
MEPPISPITDSSTLRSEDEKPPSKELHTASSPSRCHSGPSINIKRLIPFKKLLVLKKPFYWWVSSEVQNDDQKKRQPTIRKLIEKHRGYRSLSTFLDSDENFMVYRRFGYLHSRVLLRKQDQLRTLEDELDDYDDSDIEKEEQEGPASRARMVLRSRDSDEAACKRAMKENPGIRTRTDVLNDIETVLKQYGELLLQAQNMVALNKPAKRDYKSVERYIFDKQPLVDEEQGFIYNQEDLITLRDGREMALLDNFIETLLKVFHCKPLQLVFCSKTDREKTTDPNLRYYSKSRKEVATTAIFTTVLLCLLVVPIFLLNRLTSMGDMDVTHTTSIMVLLVFTLIFSAVMSLFTRAKRHEIFAASAAYCAVLVVFLSNFPSLVS